MRGSCRHGSRNHGGRSGDRRHLAASDAAPPAGGGRHGDARCGTRPTTASTCACAEALAQPLVTADARLVETVRSSPVAALRRSGGAARASCRRLLDDGLSRWSHAPEPSAAGSPERQRADALPDRGSGVRGIAVLVGDDLQLAPHHVDQLARPQQEVRVARRAVGLVADGEGLVQQHAVRADRVDDVRQTAGARGSW